MATPEYPAYAEDTPDPLPYDPTEPERKLIGEVEEKFNRWRRDRLMHEPQWFVNHAFARGHHYVEWSGIDQRLIVPPAPRHREHRTINLVQPKVRARLAKFLKNRPVPVVVPATSDIEDKQNAEATTKALDYAWRKFQLERCYRDALLHASHTGHGYWWFHWDEMALGRVLVPDEATGRESVQEGLLGDIKVEVSGPWEVLVADPSLTYIGDQPEIIRVKIRSVKDVQAMYSEAAPYLKGDADDDQAFRYERQVATITSRGLGAAGTIEERRPGGEVGTTSVLVKELLSRPCAKYPKGRVVRTAGGVLLEQANELPYGFWDLANPYPVVDFVDMALPGQYWGTTVLEQIIEPNREYNLIRSKIDESLKLMMHPKVFAARQHQMLKGAFTSEAGEVIEVHLPPNMPFPQPWVPPNVASDAWRILEMIKKEIDDISHVFPEAEGRVGASTSGFQTNLLQEATDAVHAPDIRAHELCIEEAAIKMRRVMKWGYQVPRLITVMGRNMQPEAMEFSQSQIDEQADIIVQAGSALPTLRGAKIQSVLELYNAQVLGDPADPAVKRKTLKLLEMGTVEEAIDQAQLDEKQALLENLDFQKMVEVKPPDFWEDHTIHYDTHTALLKSPDVRQWPDEKKLAVVVHLVGHANYVNPQAAAMIAQQYGLMPTGAAPPPPPAGPTGPPPPQAGPQGPPPQDAAANGANQFNADFGFGAQGDPNLV